MSYPPDDRQDRSTRATRIDRARSRVTSAGCWASISHVSSVITRACTSARTGKSTKASGPLRRFERRHPWSNVSAREVCPISPREITSTWAESKGAQGSSRVILGVCASAPISRVELSKLIERGPRLGCLGRVPRIPELVRPLSGKLDEFVTARTRVFARVANDEAAMLTD